MMARDGLLVRLRLTGGRLTADQARALSALASFYGNGQFDLSARANLQLRGIAEQDIGALQDALGDLGFLDKDPAQEAIRNVLISPLAGLTAGVDVTPVAARLETVLTSDPALEALPAKFFYLIDDGSLPSLAGVAADIRFDAVPEEADRFWIGLGGTRDMAEPLGFCSSDEIPEAAQWIARTFLTLAPKTRPPVRRMEGLIDRLGRYQASRAFGGDGSGERLPYSAALFDPPPVGMLTKTALPVLGAGAPFGRLNHKMLRAAADAAETHGDGSLRLTPWRVILLPHVADLPVPDDLTTAGFILDPRNPKLRIAACVGQEGCEGATTSTQRDAEALQDCVRHFEGSAVAIHVSGCEKGCAKASRSSATLVARNGLYDLVQGGKASDAPTKRGLDLDAVRVALANLRGQS